MTTTYKNITDKAVRTVGRVTQMIKVSAGRHTNTLQIIASAVKAL